MLPPLVSDINIAFPVIKWLRDRGVDILSASEMQWGNLSDSEILARAFAAGRFVLTHDSDFGTLAIFRGEPYFGIIYLRPGGRPPSDVIRDIAVINSLNVDWVQGTVAVFRNRRLRIRR